MTKEFSEAGRGPDRNLRRDRDRDVRAGQDLDEEGGREQDQDLDLDLDLETPEADAAEQRADLVPEGDEPPASDPVGTADPADAAEQRRVVDLDEDDYR